MVVIYYDLDTKDIVSTEDNTIEPLIPANMTFDEKKAYYETLNLGFVGALFTPSVDIFKNRVAFDLQGNFIGLQPK